MAALSPVEQQIAQAAARYGFNATAIAGLIGNATQESSLNPSLNVSGGRGLFSWNPGANPQASQVQLGNVGQQLGLVAQAIGPQGVRAMNSAGNPAAAASWFEQNFERAGIPMMQNRVAAANESYGDMGGRAPAPSAGGGGMGGFSLAQAPVPSGASFNQQAYQKALTQGLLSNLQNTTNSLFNASSPGSFNAPSASGLLAAVQSVDPSRYLQAAQNTLQALAGNNGPTLALHPGATPGYKGYVDPLSHLSLGRTDMGVDASGNPGAPIVALGDSRLAQVIPNWYAGQPLLLFQLLNGPKKGQYWYLAEQINPASTQIGHVFHAGDPVATYAQSGTGIESGWGSPTSNARTLADQQGNTGGPGHSNSPAGINYRNYIGSLPRK